LILSLYLIRLSNLPTRLVEEGDKEVEEKDKSSETKSSLISKFIFLFLIIIWNIGGSSLIYKKKFIIYSYLQFKEVS
jgi:hypothetical protein